MTLATRGNRLAAEGVSVAPRPGRAFWTEQRVAHAGNRPGGDLCVEPAVAGPGELLAHPVVDEERAVDVAEARGQERRLSLGPGPLVVHASDGAIAVLEGAGEGERAAQGFAVHSRRGRRAQSSWKTRLD